MTPDVKAIHDRHAAKEAQLAEIMRLVREYKNARGRYSQRGAYPAVEAAVRKALGL